MVNVAGERPGADSSGEVCEPHGESVHIPGVAHQRGRHQRGACVQQTGGRQQPGAVSRSAFSHRVAHLHVGHRLVGPNTKKVADTKATQLYETRTHRKFQQFVVGNLFGKVLSKQKLRAGPIAKKQ